MTYMNAVLINEKVMCINPHVLSTKTLIRCLYIIWYCKPKIKVGWI